MSTDEYYPVDVTIPEGIHGFQIVVGQVVEVQNKQGEHKKIEAIPVEMKDYTEVEKRKECCNRCCFGKDKNCTYLCCSDESRTDGNEVYFKEVI